MSSWIEISTWAGWMGCVLSSVLALPQAIALLRRRNVSGLSILPWRALLTANAAWAVYGCITEQIPVVIPNTVSAAVSTFVIVLIARANGRNVPAQLTAPLVIAAVALWAAPVPVLFGVITILPSLVGWMVQLLQIRRFGRPPGLSFGGVLLYLFCQLIWLSYALPRGEIALITSVLPLILIAAVTVLGYLAAVPTSTGGTDQSGMQLNTRSHRPTTRVAPPSSPPKA